MQAIYVPGILSQPYHPLMNVGEPMHGSKNVSTLGMKIMANSLTVPYEVKKIQCANIS